jgi:hypothetical protein
MSASIWVQRDPEMNCVTSVTLIPSRICMSLPHAQILFEKWRSQVLSLIRAPAKASSRVEISPGSGFSDMIRIKDLILWLTPDRNDGNEVG